MFCFAIGLSCLLVGFYYPWLSNQQSFYLSDLTYFYEPLLHFISEALRKNVLPAWNPYFYCGMPQIAILAPGVFYPPNWLFAFLPFSPALACFMVCHQLVAGVGGYLLVRQLSWGSAAATVCGLVLALNGYMFSLQTNFALPATASWLPVCLWSFREIVPGISSRNLMLVVASALGAFALISSGRPEISLPALAILSTYLCWDAIAVYRQEKNARHSATRVLWWFLAFILAALLSMPALLPAWEWTLLSPRAHGLSEAEIFRWSTNWYDILSLTLAQPLGDLQVLGAKFLPLVATRPGFIPYVSSAFVGPIATTLAIWGVCDTRWRGRWFVLAIFFAGLLATLGNNTPVFPTLLQAFPTLAVFRYPVKLVVVVVCCLALLAARGVFVSLCPGLSLKVLRLTWLLWIAGLCGSILLVATSQLGLQLFSSVVPPHTETNSLLAAQALIGYAGLRASIIGLGLCVAAQLVRHEKISTKTFAVLVMAGLAATLWACAFMFSRHSAPPEFFQHRQYLRTALERLPEPKPATRAFKSRILPLYFDPLTCPADYGADTATSRTVRFYQYGRELLLPCINIHAGLASSFGYEAAETNDYREIFVGVLKKASICGFLRPSSTPSAQDHSDIPLARFCQMTATAYVFTQIYKRSSPVKHVPLLDEQYFELQEESPSMNVRIYKVKETLPRAYLAKSWQWEISHQTAIKQIVNAHATSFNPHKKTILELQDTHHNDTQKILSANISTTENSFVEFLQDGPEHIALSVRAKVASYLVLADHFYPGWIAKIDNVEVPIYRANAVLRAVFVSPGSHLIEFDYNPQTLTAGLTLAFWACAVILFLLLTALTNK
ncbi:MAG: hypothetical protein HY711_09520 [Candidatus Melainabacteria bacterium]|nr:hypothetical protein [Candidatus Melainabacteria bacterium]